MNRIFRIFIFLTFASIAIYSCTHISGTFVSSHGSMESGSMKDNCTGMGCHQKGAEQGGFAVAGSIYKSDGKTRYPNGTVYLYSQPKDSLGKINDSTKVASIDVDGVGNFYTTHPINLYQGLYTIVVSSQGDTASMQDPIVNGSCNSCHGVSTVNIIVH